MGANCYSKEFWRSLETSRQTIIIGPVLSHASTSAQYSAISDIGPTFIVCLVYTEAATSSELARIYHNFVNKIKRIQYLSTFYNWAIES